jgi:hypothetical protein
VDLDIEYTQNFPHKSMRGQTKTTGEKSLEDDQLAFRLGDLLCPCNTLNLGYKISLLIFTNSGVTPPFTPFPISSFSFL